MPLTRNKSKTRHKILKENIEQKITGKYKMKNSHHGYIPFMQNNIKEKVY